MKIKTFKNIIMHKKYFLIFLLLGIQQIKLVASSSDNKQKTTTKTNEASFNKKNQNDDTGPKSFLDAVYMDLKDRPQKEINDEDTKKIIEFGFIMKQRFPSKRCSDIARTFLCNILNNNSASASASSEAVVSKKQK